MIQYRPLDWMENTLLVGARLMAGQLTLDQPDNKLGIGATAARYALDVEIEVRILDPQLESLIMRDFCLRGSYTYRGALSFALSL